MWLAPCFGRGRRCILISFKLVSSKSGRQPDVYTKGTITMIFRVPVPRVSIELTDPDACLLQFDLKGRAVFVNILLG